MLSVRWCVTVCMYRRVLTQVRIGDTMYGAGCVRYASYVDEQLYIDELVAQLITYVLVAVFSGVIIALIIAICTKH